MSVPLASFPFRFALPVSTAVSPSTRTTTFSVWIDSMFGPSVASALSSMPPPGFTKTKRVSAVRSNNVLSLRTTASISSRSSLVSACSVAPVCGLAGAVGFGFVFGSVWPLETKGIVAARTANKRILLIRHLLQCIHSWGLGKKGDFVGRRSLYYHEK
jgi:hypothetical protein